MSPVAQGEATADTSGVAKGHYANKVFSGSRSCDTTTGPRPSGQGTINSDLLAPLTGEAFNIRVTDQVRVDWQCKGDERLGDGALRVHRQRAGAGQRAPGRAIRDPPRAVGYGEEQFQNIKGPGGGFCAGAHLAGTTKCAYNWAGDVTFTEHQRDGRLRRCRRTPSRWSCPPGSGKRVRRCRTLAEPGRAAGAPGPGDRGDGRRQGLDGVPDRIVPDRLRRHRGAHGGGREGVGRRPRRASRSPRLRYKVKAGKPQQVKLRLPKKAARALRRAGRGRAGGHAASPSAAGP